MYNKIKLRLKQWSLLIIIAFWASIYATYFPIYMLYRSLRFIGLKTAYYVQKTFAKSNMIIIDKTLSDTNIDLATVSILQLLLDKTNETKKELLKTEDSLE